MRYTGRVGGVTGGLWLCTCSAHIWSSQNIRSIKETIILLKIPYIKQVSLYGFPHMSSLLILAAVPTFPSFPFSCIIARYFPSTWLYCPHTPLSLKSPLSNKKDKPLSSFQAFNHIFPPRYTCLTEAGIYTQVRTCDIYPPVFNRSWYPHMSEDMWYLSSCVWVTSYTISVISIFLIFKCFSLLLNEIHCVTASHFHKSFI